VRVQAGYWWLRPVLVALAIGVLMVHGVVTAAADATVEASATDAVVLALDAPLCHEVGLVADRHQSCAEPSFDHCDATRSSPHTATANPNDDCTRSEGAAADRQAVPRSVERPVDRAHLQVWLR
jgi:hypothetical protein